MTKEAPIRSEELYSVAEAAEKLRLHPQTIRRYLRQGVLRGAKFGAKGGYRIPATEIQRLIPTRQHEDQPSQKSPNERLGPVDRLAGYSPTVLEVGAALSYSSPSARPLIEKHEISYGSLFAALAILAKLPLHDQHQCILDIVHLVEARAARVTDKPG